MTVHLPSVGVLPQPAKYNVAETNRLQTTPSNSPARNDQREVVDSDIKLFEGCNALSLLIVGFTIVDSFYCNACSLKLVAKGGV